MISPPQPESKISSHPTTPNSPKTSLTITTPFDPMGAFNGTETPESSSYIKKQFNTRAITVWVSEKFFYIQPKYDRSLIPTVLKIDRKSTVVKEIAKQQFSSDKQKQELLQKEKNLEQERKYSKMEQIYFSFFIGIVNFQSYQNKDKKQFSIKQKQVTKTVKKVLLFAQTVKLVCSINKKDIFKIIKPIYLFYDPKYKQSLIQSEAMLLINIGFIFQQGMYYSFSYNLTEPLFKNIEDKFKLKTKTSFEEKRQKFSNSMETQSPQRLKSQEKNQQIIYSNNQFDWGHWLQKQLKDFHKNWQIPVIQGYVNRIQTYVNAEKFKIVLISRRSKSNGGPLLFTTGLFNSKQSNLTNELKVNIANYVETQQILQVKNYYFSFSQLRGTVPLYWKLIYNYGMPSGVIFDKTIEENQKGFIQHMRHIKNRNNYQKVMVLNLLDKNSVSIEKKLIQNLQYIVKKIEKKQRIHYTYFDLHNHCSNKNYQAFDKFIGDELRSILEFCGFSAFQVKNNIKIQRLHSQAGIIRTNCATCIDRTNIAQTRIAAFQLVYILRQLNIQIPYLDQSLNFVEDDSPFSVLYRNLWADNADAISEQYSGTVAMESTAIRSGKTSYLGTINHGLTSLWRVLRNFRQQDVGKNKAAQFLSGGNIISQQTRQEKTSSGSSLKLNSSLQSLKEQTKNK